MFLFNFNCSYKEQQKDTKHKIQLKHPRKRCRSRKAIFSPLKCVRLRFL